MFNLNYEEIEFFHKGRPFWEMNKKRMIIYEDSLRRVKFEQKKKLYHIFKIIFFICILVYLYFRKDFLITQITDICSWFTSTLIKEDKIEIFALTSFILALSSFYISRRNYINDWSYFRPNNLEYFDGAKIYVDSYYLECEVINNPIKRIVINNDFKAFFTSLKNTNKLEHLKVNDKFKLLIPNKLDYEKDYLKQNEIVKTIITTVDYKNRKQYYIFIFDISLHIFGDEKFDFHSPQFQYDITQSKFYICLHLIYYWKFFVTPYIRMFTHEKYRGK